MDIAFIVAALIAVAATVRVVTCYNIMHALLYLVVSLLAVSVVLYTYGAPFMAVLEIIIYAGAIMVLIIFFVMMLNLGLETAEHEKAWLRPRIWIVPGVFCLVLLGELLYLIVQNKQPAAGIQVVPPKQVGMALFGPYLIAVELTGILLMAGIVGAYHLGRQHKKTLHRFLENNLNT
ncbi:NADH-quinone oxidoreductase subunit J [Chitinophaga oryzae]|uniref:NADH-quinone oxidoreductase subunit J n=1 Tax=Chitinophaga oryzae TaxID=2725414 RepID=A0AAE7D553_9BACT|nr:NADH-quinone oxidoreductase subunit J [Chitinophaga oryzae]QJB30253.1 NADH-quinone oxidoreductase subunit J [Chitinophaga oryzae]QJB36762.1 NADH-quinone oxidoreductase subunit J [Chitinophaga oryzae]